jgi:pSer/pThr/pTyr-binding forkhead associated (FHA) protein
MDWSSTPLLFAPPLPPIALRRDATRVVGRSSSCDLPLASLEASRRHAEIHYDGVRTLLRDLGSTNGTRVNGQAVTGERELQPGDRIEIAGQVITFCLMQSRAGAPVPRPDTGEVETVLFERRTDVEALRGELAEIPSFAVLQILEMGRKTGVLQITSDGAEGRIWLEDGALVHAEAKTLLGFDAALCLVSAVKGRFAFEAGTAPPDRTIRSTVTELLLEASRIQDELDRDVESV